MTTTARLPRSIEEIKKATVAIMTGPTGQTQEGGDQIRALQEEAGPHGTGTGIRTIISAKVEDNRHCTVVARLLPSGLDKDEEKVVEVHPSVAGQWRYTETLGVLARMLTVYDQAGDWPKAVAVAEALEMVAREHEQENTGDLAIRLGRLAMVEPELAARLHELLPGRDQRMKNRLGPPW